jgi:hypothetical protein
MTTKIIKDFDGKFLDRIKRALTGKRERVVNVGFPSSAKEPDGTSTALIAAVHEYGNEHVPERAFMRTSLQKNRGRYSALNGQNLKKVLNGGMSVDAALGQLGLMASSDIKEQIKNGSYAPLKAATIKRKGSSKPLIDTGQMRQSVTYELEK